MAKPLDSKTNKDCRAEVYGDYKNLGSYKLVILEGTHERSWKQIGRRKKKTIPLEDKLERVPDVIIIHPNSKGFYLEIQYDLGHNHETEVFSLDE